MMASTADQSGHQGGGSGGGGGGNPGGGGGGPPLFVMQSMQSPSERYLSNESLENDRNSTTSSTESPNSGGVIHRKVRRYVSKHAFAFRGEYSYQLSEPVSLSTTLQGDLKWEKISNGFQGCHMNAPIESIKMSPHFSLEIKFLNSFMASIWI